MLQELLDPSPSTIKLSIVKSKRGGRGGGEGLAGQTNIRYDLLEGGLLCTPLPPTR